MGMCVVCCLMPPLCCFSFCTQGAFARQAAVDHEHYCEYMDRSLAMAFEVRQMYPPGTVIALATPPPTMVTSSEMARRMSTILWYILLPVTLVGIALYIYLAFQCSEGSGQVFSPWPTEGPCWSAGVTAEENYLQLGIAVAVLLAIGCGGSAFIKVLLVAEANKGRIKALQARYPDIILDSMQPRMPPGTSLSREMDYQIGASPAQEDEQV